MILRVIKARPKGDLREDDYIPDQDPERQRRIQAHRRRIQRALKRQGIAERRP